MTLPAAPNASLTKPRNRLLAGVILAVMALMAATGLTFALLTQHQRRGNDLATPNRAKRPLFPEPAENNPSRNRAAGPVGRAPLPAVTHEPRFGDSRRPVTPERGR